jgi:iron complex outermembrane recepter protein
MRAPEWQTVRSACPAAPSALLLCLVLAAWGSVAQAAALREDIPAQPLQTALRDFIRQTALQVVYESALAQGKHSPGAPRGTQDAQALHQLLAGTGLTFESLNPRTLRIVAEPAPTSTRAATPAAIPVVLPAIEEVIVTATQRREPLHSVPLSVGVLTRGELADTTLTDGGALLSTVPGVTYDTSAQFGSGIYKRLSLRGIQAEKSQTTTTLYLDDTPIDMPHSAFTDVYPAVFDLERVEVLRGPQGVLFGQAAEGGAVRFIATPASVSDSEQRYHLQTEATPEHGGSREGSAVVAVPIVSGVLGVRLGAWFRDEGGYVDRVNPFTGAVVEPDANRVASRAVRLSAAYEPTDNVRVTPTFYYQTQQTHDASSYFVGLSDPAAGEFRSGRLLRQPADDSFTLSSVRAELGLAGVDVTANVAYFARHAHALVDLTNEAGTFTGGFGDPRGAAYPVSPANAVSRPLAITQTQASGELRFASNSAGPVSWLGGLFFSRQYLYADEETYAVIAPATPALYNISHDRDMEASAFGTVKYQFLPDWALGAGLRVGRVQEQARATIGGYINPHGVTMTQSQGTANNPPIGRIELTYAPSSTDFLYASIAKGARRGGGNAARTLICHASPTPGTFAADALWSYEVGLRSQLLDQRLRVDVSAYEIHWDGAQLNVNDACGNPYLVNVSRITSRGGELELEGRVGRHVSLALSLAYNDQHLADDFYGAGGVKLAPAGVVTGGLPVVGAPWSGRLAADYVTPLQAGTEAFARAELVFHSRNPGPFPESLAGSPFYNSSLQADPATALAGLRGGIRRNGVELAVFVTNLFDAHPVLQRNNDVPGSDLIYGYTLRPRTLGLSVTVSY